MLLTMPIAIEIDQNYIGKYESSLISEHKMSTTEINLAYTLGDSIVLFLQSEMNHNIFS